MGIGSICPNIKGIGEFFGALYEYSGSVKGWKYSEQLSDY
jgi:hypothetical protein